MRNRLFIAAALLFASTAALAHPHLDGRARGSAPAREASGTTVLYYGGPVISNPKVYVVWWGDPANINADATNNPGGMASFFEGVLDSVFVDAWAQYDTNVSAQAGSDLGDAGTGQSIGRGNYAGTYTLSAIPSGDNIEDSQIQSALDAAITAGTLPAADANTIYAIYFPAAVSITVDGAASCGGFGAYHDYDATSGAAYLVIPDCSYHFLDFCSVSSHELAEATTDLIPTPGDNPDYPQAWNDSMGDEVADLCEATGGLIATGSGSFAVQGIWSPRSSSCATASHAAQDFSVAISPHAWNLQSGGTASLTVQTAIVAGAAQTLALSVQAATGVTATLGAASVQTGGSTTLAISSQAAISNAQIVVTATATTGTAVWTHTASLLLSVAAGTDDFSLSLSPSSAQADAGSTVTYQVQSTVLAGAVPSIALSVSGLPTGITGTFDTNPIAAGASATLSLKTTQTLDGTYPFVVVGNADTTRTASGSLQLFVPPVVDAGTDAGPGLDAGSDGGSSDAGPSGNGSAKSGCGQAPLSTLGLPLLALLLIARARRRRAGTKA